MTKQSEYRLTAQEIQDAVIEYVRNTQGEPEKSKATCWLDVPNSASQETAYAIVRFGDHK